LNKHFYCYLPILDSLLTELNKRKNAYDTVDIKFGFLFDLTKLPLSKAREQATQLQQEYPEDFGSSFSNECIHFRGHLSELGTREQFVDNCFRFE